MIFWTKLRNRRRANRGYLILLHAYCHLADYAMQHAADPECREFDRACVALRLLDQVLDELKKEAGPLVRMLSRKVNQFE